MKDIFMCSYMYTCAYIHFLTVFPLSLPPSLSPFLPPSIIYTPDVISRVSNISEGTSSLPIPLAVECLLLSCNLLQGSFVLCSPTDADLVPMYLSARPRGAPSPTPLTSPLALSLLTLSGPQEHVEANDEVRGEG